MTRKHTKETNVNTTCASGSLGRTGKLQVQREKKVKKGMRREEGREEPEGKDVHKKPGGKLPKHTSRGTRTEKETRMTEPKEPENETNSEPCAERQRVESKQKEETEPHKKWRSKSARKGPRTRERAT